MKRYPLLLAQSYPIVSWLSVILFTKHFEGNKLELSKPLKRYVKVLTFVPTRKHAAAQTLF
jgi:hypothetical protein